MLVKAKLLLQFEQSFFFMMVFVYFFFSRSLSRFCSVSVQPQTAAAAAAAAAAVTSSFNSKTVIKTFEALSEVRDAKSASQVI